LSIIIYNSRAKTVGLPAGRAKRGS